MLLQKHKGHKGWLFAVAMTVSLLLLMAMAVDVIAGLWPVIILTALVGVTVMYVTFPHSRFFDIVFANSIVGYCALYFSIVEIKFSSLPPETLAIGFVMPVATFLLSVFIKRDRINKIITDDHLGQHFKTHRGFLRLLPILFILAAVSLQPIEIWDVAKQTDAFLLAMGAASLITLWAGRNIIILLLETGLAFHDFWETMMAYVKPGFAFFSFYTMQVIIFGCLYRLIDRVTIDPQFEIAGQLQNISFVEAMYFSIITVSTVGYGDIAPIGSFLRILVSVQTIFGVLFLLFGLRAIMSHQPSDVIENKFKKEITD